MKKLNELWEKYPNGMALAGVAVVLLIIGLIVNSCA